MEEGMYMTFSIHDGSPLSEPKGVIISYDPVSEALDIIRLKVIIEGNPNNKLLYQGSNSEYAQESVADLINFRKTSEPNFFNDMPEFYITDSTLQFRKN
jgi:hypothetical protein